MSTPMGETAQSGSGDTPTATQEKGGRNDAHAFFTEGAPIKDTKAPDVDICLLYTSPSPRDS